MRRDGTFEPLDSINIECITYVVQENETIKKISKDNYLTEEMYRLIVVATVSKEPKLKSRLTTDGDFELGAGDIIYIPQVYKFAAPSLTQSTNGEDIWTFASKALGYGEAWVQLCEWNTGWVAAWNRLRGHVQKYDLDSVSNRQLMSGFVFLKKDKLEYIDYQIQGGDTLAGIYSKLGFPADDWIVAKTLNSLGAERETMLQAEQGWWIKIPIKGSNMYNQAVSKAGIGDNSALGITGYTAQKDSPEFFATPTLKNDTGIILTENQEGTKVKIKIGDGPESSDIKTTIHFDTPEMEALKNSHNIFSRKNLDERYYKFNRFGFVNPYSSLVETKEYLFFTKPELHLFEGRNPNVLNKELENYPFFKDAFRRYRHVMYQLQDHTENSFPFNPLLGNMVRSNLDLPDISADDEETMSNIYGTKMTYRGSSYKSDESHSFSLDFEDTKYLEIYMYFKIYDEYQKLKKYGVVTPPEVNYIYRKRLHDQFSIYKLVVDEDYRTIIYFGKAYGVFPVNVPRASMSDITSGPIKLSIDFKCQFVDDMDPQIFTDFNKLVRPLYESVYTQDLPLFNTDTGQAEGTWAGLPYIAVPNIVGTPLRLKGMQHEYVLGWRR